MLLRLEPMGLNASFSVFPSSWDYVFITISIYYHILDYSNKKPTKKMIKAGCSSYYSEAVTKLTKSNLGREEFISSYNSKSWCITDGSQGRNWGGDYRAV